MKNFDNQFFLDFPENEPKKNKKDQYELDFPPHPKSKEKKIKKTSKVLENFDDQLEIDFSSAEKNETISQNNLLNEDALALSNKNQENISFPRNDDDPAHEYYGRFAENKNNKTRKGNFSESGRKFNEVPAEIRVIFSKLKNKAKNNIRFLTGSNDIDFKKLIISAKNNGDRKILALLGVCSKINSIDRKIKRSDINNAILAWQDILKSGGGSSLFISEELKIEEFKIVERKLKEML